MLIENGVVYTGDRFVTGINVRILNGIVSETGEKTAADSGEIRIDLEGDYLLPGFVDVHIHAFRGSDTMRGEADIRRMSRELAKAGTGAFCPTTMSASETETREAINGVRAVMERPERNGARVLGAHMEAPFLSGNRAGAQLKQYFADPDWNALLRMTEDPDIVRLITLAPERTGSEAFIRQAAAAGIDAFLTGEFRLQDWNAVRNDPIDFAAAGHYATERFGVRALGEALAGSFGIGCTFVDFSLPW